MSKKKVVIIGGGFAGINCAKKLKNASLDITLIDKKNHHLFQPLLYQVATSTLSAPDIATPLRSLFKKQTNLKVIMGSVVTIDKQEKLIFLENGESIPFDYLVIATGTRHSYFGKDEWEEIAPGLKTISDAVKIREKILISFEKAERMEDTESQKPYLQFAIIGGGPTGVEMAGAIAELANKTLKNNFRNIDPSTSKIYLIEGLDRILPTFPSTLSHKAKENLSKMGVEVMTQKMVTHIDEEGVHFDGDFIPSKNIIWAAGNQASPLLKTLSTPLDKQGRAIVEQDLSITHFSNIFVIGDASCSYDIGKKVLPGIAPVAIQQGKYIAKILKKDLSTEKRFPFVYFDKGSLATIGKNKAVGCFRKWTFSGVFAYFIWAFVHILYLVSFRNRIAVGLEWVFHYLNNSRRARLITKNIDKT
ncbi:FAD-dependent oxidoreductase [Candidatus Aerophobetes bacterium]|uniref:NADH:ubiquinone reductase (non-electrogenic) n=1 Tax=Aerophobetes bacterium TaxID=2030807 RepID=A0A2A4X5W7_UNCAE|nr:MAG: FAD-dependent oxidoreductase [Candidatus Aerophobetes bacterium]